MKAENLKLERAILFQGDLTQTNGSQRVLFAEASFFEHNGIETLVLCLDFELETLSKESYKGDVIAIAKNLRSKKYLIKIVYEILVLRKKIREIKPNIILSQHPIDYVYLYFATLFTTFSYASHVHETPSWFESPRKYAFIYKRCMKEIRQSTTSHEHFIPSKPPKLRLVKRILSEFHAIIEYLAVRKSRKIFVLSNQMRWEVDKLYNKEAVVVRGGLSTQILDYKPRQDIKQKLGLMGKLMILTVSRLDSKKRVDLVIKAFRQVSEKFERIVLVIGGSGSEEKNLKDMVSELNLADKVKFVGFIPEEELWDYYAGCDLFVSAEWADFNITLLEALALQSKVVCPTSIEIDDNFIQSSPIYTANLTVEDFAQAMETALTTEITEKNDLSNYTWDKYCERILEELKSI